MSEVSPESLIRVNRLTDAYVKDPNSNNAKMLDLPDEEDRAFNLSMARTLSWRDIDSAEGSTLDLIGAGLGEFRGSANDEQYRILLWAQVARILCTGDINSVLHALSKTFRVDATGISLVELQNCVMKLAKMDLTVLLAAGFTIAKAREIIESLIPVGVRLDELVFQLALNAQSENLYVSANAVSLVHFKSYPA